MKRAAAIVLLCVLLLSACGSAGTMPEETGSAATGGTKVDETEILIDTPYCTLHYPNRYEEYLVLENGDKNSVEFWGRIGAVEELVFIVYFDDNGEYQVGSLDVDGSPIPVSIHFGELDVEESAGKANAEIFWTMAEDANYLADAIRQEPNFIPTSAE